MNRFGRMLVGLAATMFCWSAMTSRAASERPSDTADSRVRQIIDSSEYKAVVAVFERDFDRFVRELITLTEISAPPFGEKRRGEAYLAMLSAAGLIDCEMDAEGSVMGLWRGRAHAAPLLAVAAHLDTVFPEGTDVTVRRAGTRLLAPGVGDDSYGLAFLLALARAMREARLETAADILFVGSVGEEGPGDLRGMRYLFERGPWKSRIKRFIAVDGRSNDIVTNGALGSRRYRVTFRGPGGHSWSSFGEVSPAFALGNAIAKLGRLDVSGQPKASYNVGVISGGTSVNSIPHEVAMEVDLRSVSAEALRKLDAQFKQIVAAAVDEENAARATTFGKISAEVAAIGERPSGLTPPEAPILRQVTATMRAFDKVPVWHTSSTDANIPISLEIPALAVAAKSAARGDRAHSLDEWVDIEKGGAVDDFALTAAIILSVAEAP